MKKDNIYNLCNDLSDVELVDLDNNDAVVGILHFKEIDELFGKKVYVLDSFDDYSLMIDGTDPLTYGVFLEYLAPFIQMADKYILYSPFDNIQFIENVRFVFENRKKIKTA